VAEQSLEMSRGLYHNSVIIDYQSEAGGAHHCERAPGPSFRRLFAKEGFLDKTALLRENIV
jgi:hypothetical protein